MAQPETRAAATPLNLPTHHLYFQLKPGLVMGFTLILEALSCVPFAEREQWGGCDRPGLPAPCLCTQMMEGGSGRAAGLVCT